MDSESKSASVVSNSMLGTALTSSQADRLASTSQALLSKFQENLLASSQYMGLSLPHQNNTPVYDYASQLNIDLSKKSSQTQPFDIRSIAVPNAADVPVSTKASSTNSDGKHSGSKSGHRRGRSPSRSAQPSNAFDIWKNGTLPLSIPTSTDDAMKSVQNHLILSDLNSQMAHFNGFAAPHQAQIVDRLMAISSQSAPYDSEYQRQALLHQQLYQKEMAYQDAERIKVLEKMQKSKDFTTLVPSKANSPNVRVRENKTPNGSISEDSGEHAKMVKLRSKESGSKLIFDHIKEMYETGNMSEKYDMVTLVSEDGIKVDICKLIFIAGSSFLKNMLESDDHLRVLDKPVIILNGIKGNELRDLVQGLHLGKLNEDSNARGVRDAAEMLGIHPLVDYLQSLLNQLNRNAKSRHKTDPDSSQQHFSSQFPRKTSEIFISAASPDTPSHSDSFSSPTSITSTAASLESSSKRGTKRKSDTHLASKSKNSKLAPESLQLSESSPLNLSKTSSETDISKNETNSGSPIALFPTDASKVFPYAAGLSEEALNQYYNLARSNPPVTEFLDMYSNFAASVLAQATFPNNSASPAPAPLSKPKSSQSKGGSNSKGSKSNTRDAAEVFRPQEQLTQNILQLCATLDPATTHLPLAALDSQKWPMLPGAASLQAAAASLQAAAASDISNCNKDSNGALNLSFEKSRTPSLKSEVVQSERKVEVPSWNSVIGFNPAPAAMVDGLSSLNCDKSILGSFFQQAVAVKSSDVQNKTASVVVPGTNMSPVEDGMEDIIEVLSEENGSLISSYSGDAAKFLFNASNGRRRGKRCTKCVGCTTTEDCGNCRYCHDKAKFGGPNKLKQVCKEKRCIFETPVTSQKEKSRSRCGRCKSCLMTNDCGDCFTCIGNKQQGNVGQQKRALCELKMCDYTQMVEFEQDIKNRSGTRLSQFSADYALSEAQSAAFPSTAGSSNCPSPDDYVIAATGKKSRKKAKQKIGKDGKPVPAKPGRMKYQCNICYGCTQDTCCKLCVYCTDMPKYGGDGRFRQKCLRRLCISHPRLVSNKVPPDSDTSTLSTMEVDSLLEPYKLKVESAKLQKTAVINFIRLHCHRENRKLDMILVRVLEVLDHLATLVKREEETSPTDIDFKEERVETPNQGDYIDQYRRSTSASGSTPEPSDSSRALSLLDKNRQLPDLRPITGVPTSLSIPEVTSDPKALLAAATSLPNYESYCTVASAAVALAAAGNTLSESDFASQQFQLQVQQQIRLMQQQQLHEKSGPVNGLTAATIGPETCAYDSQGDTDVDIEKLELDPAEVATDLSSKKSPEIPVNDNGEVETVPVDDEATSQEFDAVEEAKTENADTPVEEADIAVKVSDAPVEVTETVEDNGAAGIPEKIVQSTNLKEYEVNETVSTESSPGALDEKVSPVPKMGVSPRSESRVRGLRSSPDNFSSAPKTRARSREMPERRVKRRVTRYNANYGEESEYEDVGSGFINSQRKSDTEEELLKIGSEDDEADDNIRAAVENVITNELAEDKITRNSRDKNERSSPETKLDNPDSSEMTDTPTGLKGKPIANHDANGNTDISLNLCNDSKKEVMNLQSETYLNGSLQSSYQENSQSSLETGSVGNNCNVSSKPRILLKIKQTANKGDKFSTTYDAKSVQT